MKITENSKTDIYVYSERSAHGFQDYEDEFIYNLLVHHGAIFPVTDSTKPLSIN